MGALEKDSKRTQTFSSALSSLLARLPLQLYFVHCAV